MAIPVPQHIRDYARQHKIPESDVQYYMAYGRWPSRIYGSPAMPEQQSTTGPGYYVNVETGEGMSFAESPGEGYVKVGTPTYGAYSESFVGQQVTRYQETHQTETKPTTIITDLKQGQEAFKASAERQRVASYGQPLPTSVYRPAIGETAVLQPTRKMPAIGTVEIRGINPFVLGEGTPQKEEPTYLFPGLAGIASSYESIIPEKYKPREAPETYSWDIPGKLKVASEQTFFAVISFPATILRMPESSVRLAMDPVGGVTSTFTEIITKPESSIPKIVVPIALTYGITKTPGAIRKGYGYLDKFIETKIIGKPIGFRGLIEQPKPPVVSLSKGLTEYLSKRTGEKIETEAWSTIDLKIKYPKDYILEYDIYTRMTTTLKETGKAVSDVRSLVTSKSKIDFLEKTGFKSKITTKTGKIIDTTEFRSFQFGEPLQKTLTGKTINLRNTFSYGKSAYGKTDPVFLGAKLETVIKQLPNVKTELVSFDVNRILLKYESGEYTLGKLFGKSVTTTVPKSLKGKPADWWLKQSPLRKTFGDIVKNYKTEFEIVKPKSPVELTLAEQMKKVSNELVKFAPISEPAIFSKATTVPKAPSFKLSGIKTGLVSGFGAVGIGIKPQPEKVSTFLSSGISFPQGTDIWSTTATKTKLQEKVSDTRKMVLMGLNDLKLSFKMKPAVATKTKFKTDTFVDIASDIGMDVASAVDTTTDTDTIGDVITVTPPPPIPDIFVPKPSPGGPGPPPPKPPPPMFLPSTRDMGDVFKFPKIRPLKTWKQPKLYTPSLIAVTRGIRGKTPKLLTGIEIRPIKPGGWSFMGKKKRKKKRR